MRLHLVAVLLAVAVTPVAPASAQVPIEEITPGTVLTGFSDLGERDANGNPVLTAMTAEVVGFRTLPGTINSPLIVARVIDGHEAIARSGVVAGQSGSPFYATLPNGEQKLVCALSYSFTIFSNAPHLFGCTPTDILLNIYPYDDTALMSLASSMTLESSLGERAAALLEQNLNAQGIAATVNSMMMNRTAALPKSGDSSSETLNAGDPISVYVVTGDVTIGASGTVTAVRGDRVYAFGHPLGLFGFVRDGLPFYKGRAMALLASDMHNARMSHRVGSPLGAITQDRAAGIVGVLGETPKMLPVSVTLRSDIEDGQTRAFHVARVPNMTAFLGPSIFNVLHDATGFQTRSRVARVEANIAVKGIRSSLYYKQTVRIPGNDWVNTTLKKIVMERINKTVERISASPLATSVRRVDVRISLFDRGYPHYLFEGVTLINAEGQPVETQTLASGETLRARAYVRRLSERSGVLEVFHLQIPVPKDMPNGTATLAVHAGAQLESILSGLQRSTVTAEPRTLEELRDNIKSSWPISNALTAVVTWPTAPPDANNENGGIESEPEISNGGENDEVEPAFARVLTSYKWDNARWNDDRFTVLISDSIGSVIEGGPFTLSVTIQSPPEETKETAPETTEPKSFDAPIVRFFKFIGKGLLWPFR